MLLEEDADAAKQHVTAADVTFVGAGRRVDRRENDVVPTREELRREGVVAQAAAAVHAAGARLSATGSSRDGSPGSVRKRLGRLERASGV